MTPLVGRDPVRLNRIWFLRRTEADKAEDQNTIRRREENAELQIRRSSAKVLLTVFRRLKWVDE